MAEPFLVKDINPGSDDSSPVYFDGRGRHSVLQCQCDGLSGRELWKSDGTDAGTVLVRDINPGSGYSLPAYTVWSPAVIADTLYFKAIDGTTGGGLWKSDGTEAGTVLVKDINPFSNAPYGGGPNLLTTLGDTLYFTADDASLAQSCGRATALRLAPSWSRTSTLLPVLSLGSPPPFS